MEGDNDYVGQVIAEDTEARSPKRLSNDPAQPPAGYAPCSPGLLESGVDCATAPRWSSPTWDGHSHWHPVPPKDASQITAVMDLFKPGFCNERMAKDIIRTVKGFDAVLPVGGEVEVLRYMFRFAGCVTTDGPQNWRTEIEDEMPAQFLFDDGRVTDVVELVDRAHVTRLTAERDGLLAQLTESRRQVQLLNEAGEFLDDVSQGVEDKLRDERDVLQSDLTKARELNEQLSIALSELDSTLRVVAVAGSKTALSSLRTLAKRSLNIVHGLLSDQSAPAAKGDSDA